jgi:hypothetical protein
MHLKVFVKLKKTLKPPCPGKKTQKNPKKPKKPKKTQKNPLGWFFFKKNRVFSNPGLLGLFVGGGPLPGIELPAIKGTVYQQNALSKMVTRKSFFYISRSFPVLSTHYL